MTLRPTSATRVLAAMLATGALLQVAALWGHVGSPIASLFAALTEGNYAVSSALAGSFLIEWIERPHRRRILVAVGIVLAAIQGVIWRMHGQRLGFLFFNLATPFGVLAILSRAWDVVRAPRQQRRFAFDELAVTLLLPVFCVVGEKLLSTLSIAYPTTLDGGLLLADRSLGDAPSYSVGRFVQHNGLVRRLVDIVYVELPFAFVVVDLATAKTRSPDHRLLREFCLYGAASFILLPIVPASGPVYAFPDFPETIPSVATTWTAVPQWAFRNCVPSMHTTWAFLLFHRARHAHVAIRLFATFWLTFTLLATLGKGEHYVLDLVVAFPFLLVLETIRAPSLSLPTGLVLLFSWLGALRFGSTALAASPRATALAELVTVAVCATMTWRLNGAMARVEPKPAPRPDDVEPAAASRRDAA